MGRNDKTIKPPRSLIYELGYTGHRSEYVAHLMRFINSQPDLHDKFVFVLNEQISELIGELSTSPNYLIEFLKLNNQPLTDSYHRAITLINNVDVDVIFTKPIELWLTAFEYKGKTTMTKDSNILDNMFDLANKNDIVEVLKYLSV